MARKDGRAPDELRPTTITLGWQETAFAELTRADRHAPYGARPAHRFLASGDPEFRRVGARFLGPEIGTVERALLPCPPGGKDS